MAFDTFVAALDTSQPEFFADLFRSRASGKLFERREVWGLLPDIDLVGVASRAGLGCHDLGRITVHSLP